MNYKLLALDLDDTLLNDELEISEENVSALKSAHLKGVKIVIATGRASSSSMAYIEKLDMVEADDFFITYNGANISNRNGDILFEEVLERKHLESLINIGREYDTTVQLYSQTELFAENYTAEVKRYEEKTAIKATIIKDLHCLTSSIKLLYNSINFVVLEEIKNRLIDLYGSELNIFYSKPTYLEVLSKKANKGLALKHLAERLQIQQSEIIAVGDSFNDISMINYAGLGVCVQNGKDAVKMEADYVTERTNSNHAIAEVISRFI